MAPTTTTVESQQFRINSLYDPDYTGVGGQPRYYDQLVTGTMYRAYRVDKVGYKITLVNKADNDSQFCIMFRDQDTVSYTSPSQMYTHGELDRTYVYNLPRSTNDNSKRIIKGSIEPYRVQGLSKLEYMTSRAGYVSAYNGNPQNIAYMTVSVSDDANGSSGANVDVYVELLLFATLSNLQHEISQS